MQKRGLAYEKKILKLLKAHYEEVVDHPWIRYPEDRYCQPDAIILNSKRFVVVEIKLSFREEAIEKLRLLYEPLVAQLYPGRRGSVCQITRTIPEGFQEDIYNIEDILTTDLTYITIQSTGK